MIESKRYNREEFIHIFNINKGVKPKDRLKIETFLKNCCISDYRISKYYVDVGQFPQDSKFLINICTTILGLNKQVNSLEFSVYAYLCYKSEKFSNLSFVNQSDFLSRYDITVISRTLNHWKLKYIPEDFTTPGWQELFFYVEEYLKEKNIFIDYEYLNTYTVHKPTPAPIKEGYGVYGIYYNDRLLYIGKTSRAFKKRFKEHQNIALKQNTIPTGMERLYTLLQSLPNEELEYKVLIDVESLRANMAISERDIESMEYALILEHQPPGNTAGVVTPYLYSTKE